MTSTSRERTSGAASDCAATTGRLRSDDTRVEAASERKKAGSGSDSAVRHPFGEAPFGRLVETSANGSVRISRKAGSKARAPLRRTRSSAWHIEREIGRAHV